MFYGMGFRVQGFEYMMCEPGHPRHDGDTAMMGVNL